MSLELEKFIQHSLACSVSPLLQQKMPVVTYSKSLIVYNLKEYICVSLTVWAIYL